jgi:hypothetical protein
MATVEVTKAVDRLPPIIAACNTKALESLESVEAVNPPEEAPAAAAKDIAHMNISENPGTPQKTEGSEEQKAKEHEDQVQLTVPRRTESIRLTEHPETSQQTIEQLASKFEEQKTLPPSTEKLPKTESPTKQDSQQVLKVVKKAAVEKDDESSSSSSSSEDEKEKPKEEKKHSFGLSQAISSGLAGATAGIASTLTGNATSAVLAAMHRTIGNKKPTSTHDKGAKPSEKSDNTKPNGDSNQSQPKVAKAESPSHRHSHHHRSRHGRRTSHSHEGTEGSHREHSRHSSSRSEHSEGSHHERSHSHRVHSNSPPLHSHHHRHSHGSHDHSTQSPSGSANESSHSHRHHHHSRNRSPGQLNS